MIPHAVLKEASQLTAEYIKAKIDEDTKQLIDALDITDDLGAYEFDTLTEKVKFELGKLLAVAYRNGYINHYESTQRKKILM